MIAPFADVLVEDFGVDAAVLDCGSGRVLVLRPGQTITSAVTATQALCPTLGADQTRSLVRNALPDNIDVMYDLIPPPPSPDSHLFTTRGWLWLIALLAVAAVVIHQLVGGH